MANDSDIFFENYAPGVAARLGLGYKTQRDQSAIDLLFAFRLRPGRTYRDVKAYDLLIQGEGGIIATTGYPEKPAKAGIAIADIASGMYAVIGIVLALYEREKTGAGQLIDVSMLDSIVSWLGYFPHHYWHAGEEPGRAGMRHHYVTPYGPYLTADGEYVNLAVASPADWQQFCRWSSKSRNCWKTRALEPSRIDERTAPRWKKSSKRFFRARSQAWLAQLKQAEMPHGIVRGIAQVLAHPQVAARN